MLRNFAVQPGKWHTRSRLLCVTLIGHGRGRACGQIVESLGMDALAGGQAPGGRPSEKLPILPTLFTAPRADWSGKRRKGTHFLPLSPLVFVPLFPAQRPPSGHMQRYIVAISKVAGELAGYQNQKVG